MWHMAPCYQWDVRPRAQEMLLFPSMINLMMLTLEAQRAIWLRSVRLALGGAAAEAEAAKMISEKFAAAAEATQDLIAGASPDRGVKGYRRKVRAKIKRLSRRA